MQSQFITPERLKSPIASHPVRMSRGHYIGLKRLDTLFRYVRVAMIVLILSKPTCYKRIDLVITNVRPG